MSPRLLRVKPPPPEPEPKPARVHRGGYRVRIKAPTERDAEVGREVAIEQLLRLMRQNG